MEKMQSEGKRKSCIRFFVRNARNGKSRTVSQDWVWGVALTLNALLCATPFPAAAHRWCVSLARGKDWSITSPYKLNCSCSFVPICRFDHCKALDGTERKSEYSTVAESAILFFNCVYYRPIWKMMLQIAWCAIIMRKNNEIYTNERKGRLCAAVK